jgi:quinol monooxygenase YgiN
VVRSLAWIARPRFKFTRPRTHLPGYPSNNETAARPRTTTISSSRKLVTLINVFTVAPSNQRQLLDLLARATETSVRHAPGFISASLHRGLDGTKVTMYAQWRSVEDYEAMRENPAPLPYLQQALAIAKFDPGVYEVFETYSGFASAP